MGGVLGGRGWRSCLIGVGFWFCQRERVLKVGAHAVHFTRLDCTLGVVEVVIFVMRILSQCKKFKKSVLGIWTS